MKWIKQLNFGKIEIEIILDETLDEVKEMSQEEYDVLHDEAQDK